MLEEEEEEEARLTVHIQAVVSDPFLSTQGWVGRLAAQRRAVIFPFHWDTNGVGHAESLAVILLRHSTWTERHNELMQGTGWIDSVVLDHVPIRLTMPARMRGSLFAIKHKKLSVSCNAVNATDLYKVEWILILILIINNDTTMNNNDTVYLKVPLRHSRSPNKKHRTTQ